MFKLIFILLISLFLAYCSQNGIMVYEFVGKNNKIIKIDIPLIVLIIVLSLFCGLRTDYNDTAHYRRSYNGAPTVTEYLNNDPKFTGNPLFYLMQSFFKHTLGVDFSVFIMLIAIFTNCTFISFIKRHSESFVFSILLFFCLGLYVDTLAAIKQCLALAVLTHSLDLLIKKKFLKFYLVVLIAILIHTYAIFFIILPLFVHKPWSIITYITIFGFAVVLLTFQSTITSFLSVAEDAGKNLAEEELFDNIGINPLRLAVFAVPTLLSFFFQEHLDDIYDTRISVFMNMGILSFLVMSLGLFTAANLFGRSAMYFEIGSIIILPSIIKRIFTKESSHFISLIICALYIGFFMYDNSGFSIQYRAMTIFEFFKTAL